MSNSNPQSGPIDIPEAPQDTLDTIIYEVLTSVMPELKQSTYDNAFIKAKQQIKEWAYQETLNLLTPPQSEYTQEQLVAIARYKARIIAKAAAKWGKQ